MAATLANNPAPIQQLPFDYQATLNRITKDIKMTLKAKFNTAIANLQQSFMNLECRVDQKLQMHMDTMKGLQADKSTQDNHTHPLHWVPLFVFYFFLFLLLLLFLSFHVLL